MNKFLSILLVSLSLFSGSFAANAADSLVEEGLGGSFVEVHLGDAPPDIINLSSDEIGKVARKHLNELLAKAQISQLALEAHIGSDLEDQDLWQVLFLTKEKDLAHKFRSMTHHEALERVKCFTDYVNGNYNYSGTFLTALASRCVDWGSFYGPARTYARNQYAQKVVSWIVTPLAFEIFKHRLHSTIGSKYSQRPYRYF